MSDPGDEKKDSRAAQSGSPIALYLIDELADDTSTIFRSLRISDLFMFRRTCREAWKRVRHVPLTAGRLEVIAGQANPTGPHPGLLGLCARFGLLSDIYSWAIIGESGDRELVLEAWRCAVPECSGQMLFRGVLSGGHTALAAELLQLNDTLPLDVGRMRLVLALVGCEVAKCGWIELARRVESNRAAWREVVGRRTPLYRALSAGRRSFVEWVLEGESPQEGDRFVFHAARSGCVELVSWLADHGWPVDADAMCPAAASGSTEMLDWLSARGLKPTFYTLQCAINCRRENVVDWYVKNGHMVETVSPYVCVREHSVNVVARFVTPRQWQARRDLGIAACQNKLGSEVLLWLLEQGVTVDPIACMHCSSACDAVEPALIRSLFNVPLVDSFMYHAAKFDRIDRIRYGLGNGGTVTANALLAMLDGRPAILDEVLRHLSANDAAQGLLEEALAKVDPVNRRVCRQVYQVLRTYGLDEGICCDGLPTPDEVAMSDTKSALFRPLDTNDVAWRHSLVDEEEDSDSY